MDEYIEEIEEEIEEESFFKSFPVKVFFVALLIISLIYISGIREYLFYQRTPTSTKLQAPEPLFKAEEIIVPVSVFVVKEGPFRSERSKEETEHILSNGFRVFVQANIDFEVVEYSAISAESYNFLSDHRSFLSEVEKYDPDTINIFLVGHLKGINGIAFPGLSSLAVADYVTSRDYRILAHEIGHILGLGHSSDPFSVMYQGSYGVNLSMEKAIKAREKAKKYEL